jgi:hypothetical protein
MCESEILVNKICFNIFLTEFRKNKVTVSSETKGYKCNMEKCNGIWKNILETVLLAYDKRFARREVGFQI